jgi:hypothetical protein
MQKDKPFRISSACTNDKFMSFNLVSPENGDWDLAISVFKSRFWTRYFNPIRQLLRIVDEIETDDIEEMEMIYPGFLTLSIDCILLETLNQFKHGISDSEVAFHSSCAFVDVLMSTEKLKPFFESKSDAYKFYSDIRCGLIHQGETKGYSLLNIKKDIIVNHYSVRGKGFSVNRIDFHQLIVDEYLSYMDSLLDLNNRRHDQLRLNFRNKMYFLCGENLPQSIEPRCRVCNKELRDKKKVKQN